jgi:hypothetical protein
VSNRKTDEFLLEDVFAIVWKRKWIVIASIAIVMLSVVLTSKEIIKENAKGIVKIHPPQEGKIEFIDHDYRFSHLFPGDKINFTPAEVTKIINESLGNALSVTMSHHKKKWEKKYGAKFLKEIQASLKLGNRKATFHFSKSSKGDEFLKDFTRIVERRVVVSMVIKARAILAKHKSIVASDIKREIYIFDDNKKVQSTALLKQTATLDKKATTKKLKAYTRDKRIEIERQQAILRIDDVEDLYKMVQLRSKESFLNSITIDEKAIAPVSFKRQEIIKLVTKISVRPALSYGLMLGILLSIFIVVVIELFNRKTLKLGNA